jgi:hypothetical protein
MQRFVLLPTLHARWLRRLQSQGGSWQRHVEPNDSEFAVHILFIGGPHQTRNPLPLRLRDLQPSDCPAKRLQITMGQMVVPRGIVATPWRLRPKSANRLRSVLEPISVRQTR